MKAAILATVLGIISLLSLSAAAQSTCSGGGNAGEVQPYPPYSDQGHTYQQPDSDQIAASPAAPSTAPAAPQARISIVGSGNESVAGRPPAARLSIVSATPLIPSEPEPPVAPETVAQVPEKPAEPPVEEKLPAGLEGLVGTWLAVARHGDGELTTIELRLDDRGWAELTLPGPDGKPATTKRRVEFDDKELKLDGPDAASSLGKLIESTSRQMVLSRPSGNVTFVRQ